MIFCSQIRQQQTSWKTFFLFLFFIVSFANSPFCFHFSSSNKTNVRLLCCFIWKEIYSQKWRNKKGASVLLRFRLKNLIINICSVPAQGKKKLLCLRRSFYFAWKSCCWPLPTSLILIAFTWNCSLSLSHFSDDDIMFAVKWKFMKKRTQLSFWTWENLLFVCVCVFPCKNISFGVHKMNKKIIAYGWQRLNIHKMLLNNIFFVKRARWNTKILKNDSKNSTFWGI